MISGTTTTCCRTIQGYIYTHVDGKAQKLAWAPMFMGCISPVSQCGSLWPLDLALRQLALPQFQPHATTCLPPSVRVRLHVMTRCCIAPRRTTRCTPMIVFGSVLRALPHKKQSSATTLLCDFEQQRDFSRAIASRASKVVGAVSRYTALRRSVLLSAAQVAPHVQDYLWLIRVMCNGLYTARRFHVHVDEEMFSALQ